MRKNNNEYDEDLIENINNDFCQGFDIAKRMAIDMCKNAWWLRTLKQENVIRSEKTDAYTYEIISKDPSTHFQEQEQENQREESYEL